MEKRKQIIEIVPYDPNWTTLFNDEILRLKPIFADNLVAIHHVGSTAVHGMQAKPTIDILIEVKNIELVDQYNLLMSKLGYEAWGEYGIIGRRFFLKGVEKRTHHVHVFQIDNPEIARHIYLREYLKTHPEDAKQYSNFKAELSQKFLHDRQKYNLGKHDFVKMLEKKAIKWFSKL